MAVVIVIPGPLRDFAGGRDELRVEEPLPTVGAALDHLAAIYPRVRERIITELGTVRPHVNIFVDGENIRLEQGLETPLRANAEVLILPALSGG